MNSITIPIISNRGRTGFLHYSPDGKGKNYMKMNDGIEYWDIGDSYMHIDAEKESLHYGKAWQPSFEEYVSVVQQLCIFHFASKLPYFCGVEIPENKYVFEQKSIKEWFSGLKNLVQKRSFLFEKTAWYKKYYINWRALLLFKMTNYRILIKKTPPLGGTWQKYFTDHSWLKEAEKIKGSKIYLA